MVGRQRRRSNKPFMLSTRLPLLTILEYPASIVVDNARSPYYSASSSSFKKDGDLPRLCFYKETMKKSKSQRQGTSSSSSADDRAPGCRRRGSRRCSFPSPENEKNTIMMNRWESSMSHPTATSGTPKGGGDKAPIRRCRSFDDSSSDLRSKQQIAEGLSGGPLDCCLSEAFDSSNTLDSEPRQPTRRNSLGGGSSSSSLDDILQDALDVIDSVEFESEFSVNQK